MSNKKTLSPFEHKLGNNPVAGLDNTKLDEKQPRYARAEAEIVYPKEVRNNARIIIGRDRNADITSGYGGRGHTMCGAIDLVVGLQGWDPAEGGKFDEDGETWIGAEASKNFGSIGKGLPGDAARIYISQRADIDQYFDLAEGNVGNSVAESAIGMCADQIRIVARKGIKIVSGTTATRNSRGGKIRIIHGIDIIAGNKDEDTGRKLPTEAPRRPVLQPIPKGENLQAALETMMERIEGLNHMLTSITVNMQKMVSLVLEPRTGANAGGPVVATLTAGIGTATTIMTDLQRQAVDLEIQRKAINAAKGDFLNVSGCKYINSRHNRVN